MKTEIARYYVGVIDRWLIVFKPYFEDNHLYSIYFDDDEPSYDHWISADDVFMVLGWFSNPDNEDEIKYSHSKEGRDSQ